MLNTDRNKDELVFIHGNGFTPKSYSTFLSLLQSEYSINPFLLRPLWDTKSNYSKLKDWGLFYNDFEKFLNKNFSKSVIGIGHSIGGNIILTTALKKQNSFKSIVLLDPTIFAPKMVYLWKIANLFNLTQYLHPLSIKAKNKKMFYETYQEIFKSYRSKKVFDKIGDNELKIFINSITETKDGKLHIIYPNIWEYQIYNKGLLLDNYIWKNIHRLNIPCLIIRAHKSNAFLNSAATLIKKLNPKIKIISIEDSTHLYPLAYPNKTYEHVSDYLDN